jgi:hypothetical protein
MAGCSLGAEGACLWKVAAGGDTGRPRLVSRLYFPPGLGVSDVALDPPAANSFQSLTPHLVQATHTNPRRAQIEAVAEAGIIEKVHFARDLLPQLGFLGTLIGLSLAMMQLANTDPVQIILERPGISPELTFNLGLAFNTTFIALLLSALLSLYCSHLAGLTDYYRLLIERLRKAG